MRYENFCPPHIGAFCRPFNNRYKINLFLYRTIQFSQGFQCIFYIFDPISVRCACWKLFKLLFQIFFILMKSEKWSSCGRKHCFGPILQITQKNVCFWPYLFGILNSNLNHFQPLLFYIFPRVMNFIFLAILCSFWLESRFKQLRGNTPHAHIECPTVPPTLHLNVRLNSHLSSFWFNVAYFLLLNIISLFLRLFPSVPSQDW